MAPDEPNSAATDPTKTAAIPSPPYRDAGETAGNTVGPYRLLQVLGEGGFGVVWLADRLGPITQRVALKVIRAGMDTHTVIARFEQERQALAVMNHPNVAKVLDAGATDKGRPYFVMEHVPGEPITVYCDRQRLSIAERLQLFIPVCEAVQHAHHKGIIHRDLKPSNILVGVYEGRPQPKVIDFGVAKAVSHTLTEKTIFTETGQLIGTPEYMSPEQAEMGATDVDTRTDVYSLGIVLYELLAGVPPFDPQTLREGGFDDIRKIIREREAPKPSTRVSGASEAAATSVAGAREMKREDLARQLRRELDWIPLKAIRKDRSDRYATAMGLAKDIRRYLDGEPLEAGPESTVYKLRKVVRQNKGAVAAAGLIAACLLLAAGVSIRFALRESAAAASEAMARKRAEATIEFVVKTLRSSDPRDGGDKDTTIAQAMDNVIREIDAGAFMDDPGTEAGLRDAIGTILENNGRADEAERQFDEALAINRRLSDGPRVAIGLNKQALVLHTLGRDSDAERLLVEALELDRRLYNGDHALVANSLNNLGLVVQALGRPAEAESRFTEALEMRRRLFTGDHKDVANSLNNLAVLRQSQAGPAQAEPLFAEVLAMRRRLFDPYHRDMATSVNNLGTVLLNQGHHAKAEPLFAEALEIHRHFGVDHPQFASALHNLALARKNLGQAAEAERLFVEALDTRRRLFKGDHPEVASSLYHLAIIRRDMDRLPEAEPLFVEALEMQRRLFKDDNAEMVASMESLAYLSKDIGRGAEAEALIVEALEMRRRLQGIHMDVANNLFVLASWRRDRGGFAEAEPLLVEAVGLLRQLSNGRDQPEVVSGLVLLARTRQDLRKTAAARAGFDEAVAMFRRLSPDGSPGLARVLWRSGTARLDNGDAASALPELEEALEMATKYLPAEDAQRTEYRDTLDRCRQALDSPKDK